MAWLSAGVLNSPFVFRPMRIIFMEALSLASEAQYTVVYVWFAGVGFPFTQTASSFGQLRNTP